MVDRTTADGSSCFIVIIVNEFTFYERGLSFFSLYKASNDTLATLTTCKTRKREKRLRLVTDVHMQFDLHVVFRRLCEIYLESNTGNVTNSMTFTTETSDQDFIVLFNVI